MLLGNTSWRIKGVEMGKVRVEDAHGAPPNIPFWRGEAPSRTSELSSEVARLRGDLDDLLFSGNSLSTQHSVLRWLQQECALDQRGAQQAIEYVLAGKAVLGTVPTQQTIVAERFFDESGGMQLVLHTPFGGRINRAWGLALRKRFCVTFDFELQAAATDNGIVISLGEKHSFPLEAVFGFLHSQTLREVLLPAVLQAPMFVTRWRWNVSRSLVLLRFSHGKKVPPQIQRMKAEDLLGAVFPDAMACQDNIVGERTRQIPDHPLVNETLRDCFTEAMDLDGLTVLLKQIEAGAIRCVAVDTPMPSPFSHEILNANPYAFLDDAPLEERRARAVEMRRTLPAQLSGEIGALDPAAIEEVQRESWPIVRDPDELHDALLTLFWLPVEEVKDWAIHLPRLTEEGRAVELNVRGEGGRGEGLGVRGEVHEVRGWVATENQAQVEALLVSGDDATLDAIVQGWMESIGPITSLGLAARLGLSSELIQGSLLRLEASGQVLRGRFRPAGPIQNSKLKIQNSGEAIVSPEWCHRRLLARIHRLTIGRLRKEVEPVTAAEFMRFLFQWQHVSPGSRLHGEAGLLDIIAQLAGFEAAASAWEPHLLRTRLAKYEPDLLDRLCLSGAVSWGRLSPHPRLAHGGDLERRRIIPTSVAPISFFPREESEWLRDVFHDDAASKGPDPFALLSSVAQDLRRTLHERGASFFADLMRMTNHLPAEVEEGLWELVAAGLVTADGFDNLRALMDPRRRRAEGRERSRRPRHSAGRWALLRQAAGHQRSVVSSESTTLVTSRLTPHASHSIEPVARQLLRRYGVVFRDLLGREALALSWRDLLMQYRRMELQGEIRGGRFVNGFTGEQFALPEAVESLRAVRKRNESGAATHDIKLSASDPLNLAGVILPGPRVPAVPSNFVVFRDGAVVRAVLGREAADRPSEQIEWSGRANQVGPHYS